MVFALGVLLTGVLIVAAVFAITGDPRAATAPERAAGAGTSGDPAAVADAAQAFVAGAKVDITAVTQYDYRSLDVALAAGLDVTTGSYRAKYRAALTGALATQARATRAVQSFTISAAGIGRIEPDLARARVMLFGVQSLTRGDARAVQTPVTLTATMVKRGDRYLIGDLGIGTNPGLPTGSADLASAAEAARRHTIAGLSTGGRTGRVTAVAVEAAAARQVIFLVAGSNGVAEARLRVTTRKGNTGWTVVASQSAIV